MQWYLKVLRQYADFEGRARRTEFWMFALFSALCGLAALALDGAVSAVGARSCRSSWSCTGSP